VLLQQILCCAKGTVTLLWKCNKVHRSRYQGNLIWNNMYGDMFKRSTSTRLSSFFIICLFVYAFNSPGPSNANPRSTLKPTLFNLLEIHCSKSKCSKYLLTATHRNYHPEHVIVTSCGVLQTQVEDDSLQSSMSSRLHDASSQKAVIFAIAIRIWSVANTDVVITCNI
jgi:hypothetical protein